jgi:putative ABC transport system permease protein
MLWVLLMAWRDSRGFRRRLLLYTSAIGIGIAALTALRGLSRAMEEGVAQQASELLGADMEVVSDRPFSAAAEVMFDSLGGRQSRMVETFSMVLLPESGGTRLCEVRAIGGGWPFYGELRTDPPSAAQTFLHGREALVDNGILLQYGAGVGDSIKVGRVTFRIAGRLLGIPGETAVRTDVRPPVLIPYQYLERTELVQYGSRVKFKALFRFDDGRDVEELAQMVEDRLRASDLNIDADTAADRQRRLGRTVRNLDRFLGLGGFIALLLGAIGVASAIHAYIEQKLESVAILRSLGATGRQALWIYMVQAGAMGLIGSAGGAVAGVVVLLALPGLVADFLPGTVEVSPSPGAALEGIVIGTLIALLFAARPLLAVRSASPLLALRASYETGLRPGDRVLRGLVTIAAAGGAYLLARLLAGRADHALFFTVGTATALLLLALSARLLRGSVRRFFPRSFSYVKRQGLANLYRPHNQTLLLMVSLGLGTFLVAALYTAQNSVLAHISRIGGDDQPNVVLFDIQTDQVDGVAHLVREMDMPVLQLVPIVAMHITAVAGTPADSLGERGGWALNREYRSTYRADLADSETLVGGTWHGDAPGAFVSLEIGVAERLGVEVGDSLTFDVQGVPITVAVGSLRRVDWQRIMPNFLCVFSPGVLEAAPQFHVLVTRGDSPESRAEMQRRMVESYPNVLAIDLDLILRTVDEILDRIAALVRFMALFSVATGVVVLVASVSASRFQRLRESALLRTLGASRQQVGRILVVEYAALGTLAGLTGLLLAVGGGWGLSTYVFEVTFAPAWGWLAMALVAVPALTVAVGLSGSRGVTSVPPLEVLRRAG